MSGIASGYRELAAKCEQLLQQADEERYKSVLRGAAAKLRELADREDGRQIQPRRPPSPLTARDMGTWRRSIC